MRRIALVTLPLAAILLVASGLWCRPGQEMIGDHTKADWVSRLTDPRSETRKDALMALRLMTLTESSVVDLILLASLDEDPKLRELGTFALGEVGQNADAVDRGVIGAKGPAIRPEDRSRVMIALRALLQDDDAMVRTSAAKALAGSGPEAIQPALSLVESSRSEVRYLALRALGSRSGKDERTIFDCDAGRVAQCLVSCTRDPDVEMRERAITTISEIDFGPREVRQLVPAVLAALHDEDEKVRQRAARTLRDFAQSERTRFGIGL